jgi:RNA polymerase sigma-70 factor, ECF subfamily
MDAIRFLYVRYSGEVMRLVRGMIKDRHEAEDITQSVFVKMVGAIDGYEPREVPFSAWILRIARNCALDHLRAQQRTLPSEEVIVLCENGVRTREQGRNIRRALDDLPKEQRDVIILRHLLGLSPVEIADILGKSESSIHGLHHRGRMNLQGALVELDTTPTVAPRAPAAA